MGNLRKMKEIIFNWMLDLRKKEIEPLERARIINEYMKANKLSQRELAKQLGISHSTLADWCRWGKITKLEYKQMKRNGLNDTDIYRGLRNNSNNKITFNNFINNATKLDQELEKAFKVLNPFVLSPRYSEKTINLINQIRNTLNRMELHIEKKMKKGVF